MLGSSKFSFRMLRSFFPELVFMPYLRSMAEVKASFVSKCVVGVSKNMFHVGKFCLDKSYGMEIIFHSCVS